MLDHNPISANFDFSNIFIGREQQLRWFSNYLSSWVNSKAKISSDSKIIIPPSTSNKIPGLLVLLYGRGGFGKTTLLHRFHKLALTTKDHLTVSQIIDWEVSAQDKSAIFSPTPGEKINSRDYFSILHFELARALEKTPDSFKGYLAAAKAVEQAEKQAQGVLQALQEDDKFAWLRSGISGLVVGFLREILPGSNLVLDDAKSEKLKNVLGDSVKVGAEHIALIRARITEKLGPYLDDYLEPHRRLAFGLGRDLTRFAGRWGKVLIFFDTYEEIDEGDHLFRLLMMSAGPKVGWVVAGRSNLWAGREQRLRSLEVEYGYRDIVLPERGLAIPFSSEGEGEFSQGDIETYFKKLSETIKVPPLSSEDAKKVLAVTRGVPLAVKIAAGLFSENTNLEVIIDESGTGGQEIVDIMVRRYLLHSKSDIEERSRLYGLAMLRRADYPHSVATALRIPPEEIEAKYDTELRRLHRRYSFIFTEKEKPSLHQDVRYFLRKWLLERRTNPEVVGINERMLKAHEDNIKRLEASRDYISLEERFQDKDWLQVYLNYVEQQFWIDPIRGLRSSLPFMIVSSVYSRHSVKEMVEVGNFFRSLFNDNEMKLWDACAKSLIYLSGQDMTNEDIEKLIYLEQLDDERILVFPEFLPKRTEEIKAAVHWRLGEAYAVKDVVKSVEWYEKALEILGKNLLLKSATSEVMYHTANNFYIVSDNQQAIEYYLKGIKLNPSDPKLFFRVGRAYTNLGDNNLAIEYFHRALAIDPNNALSTRGLATSYRYTDLDKAIEYALRSTLLDEDDADSFDYLGLLYRDKLEIEKAIVAHEQARSIKAQPTTDFFLSLLYAYQKDQKKALARISSANKLLEEDEFKGKIREVWIKIINWGQHIIKGDLETAREISIEMQKFIKTRRTLDAIMSHIVFLLKAVAQNSIVDDYISLLSSGIAEPIKGSADQVTSNPETSSSSTQGSVPTEKP